MASKLLDYNIDYSTIDGSFSFDASGLVNFGNRFDLKNENDGIKSISLLTELGYSLKSYSITYWQIEKESPSPFDGIVTERVDLIYEYNAFNTINAGVLLKINFHFPNYKYNPNPSSICIGAGIKLPFSQTSIMYKSGSTDVKKKENYSSSEISGMYTYPIMPYIKIFSEVRYYVSKKIAITVGGYGSYNFGMKYNNIYKINEENNSQNIYNTDSKRLLLTKYSFSSIDFGFTCGIHFGGDNPKK